MKTVITLVLALSVIDTHAQEIAGRVLDKNKEPAINATVQAYVGGMLRDGNITDFDGNYIIKLSEPGVYDLLLTYLGFDSILATAVVVSPGELARINFALIKSTGPARCIVFKNLLSEDKVCFLPGHKPNDIYTYMYQNIDKYPPPVIPLGARVYKGTLYTLDGTAADHAEAGFCCCACNVVDIQTGYSLTKEEIDRMPASTVDDLLSIFPSINQHRRGDQINIRGGGKAGNAYYIDGVRQ